MPPLNRSPAQPSGIRAFLIADIRGYTRFTAQHGDDAASRLATEFAEVMAEGVEAHGGEVVELRGDEALAVFDSARQALRAAAELRSAFSDESTSAPQFPLPVGIGLDAGEAVPVGDGYRGAALNLAARLCSIAGPGDVLATEGLVHLAGHTDGLMLTRLEPTRFKGYDEPITAVRIGAEEPPPAVVRTSDRSRTEPLPLPPELDPIVPLAGRVSELRWLRWHWRRALHGHSRTLVISGPPGIGKTRLSAELATHANAMGAMVVYGPATRGIDPVRLGDPVALGTPTLVIVDDLDAAAARVVRDVEQFALGLSGRSVLLLVTHRREAPPALTAIAERLAPPEQRRQLGPLDADAVHAIAALYAGHGVDELPIDDLVTESAGVPAAIHQVASRWARDAARSRLDVSADRTAAGRIGLRAAESVLVGDVQDLETARERARLYGVGSADMGGRGARMICPYKGLAEFEAADADYYFGRERLIAELVARSVGSTFLALVGDSGSGKSSALRAGLLPALAGGVLPGSDDWRQVVMRPTERPLDELSRALARALPDRAASANDPSVELDSALAGLATGQRLVLVVDQFEETFSATRDEAQRSAFIDLLTSVRPGLKVVVAIRADHYGRCAAYPALARLVGADHVLVGPLTGAELAAVIEHPAQRVGLRVEEALTQALVADAGTDPGVLPLLSTALLELWQDRQDGRLTLAAYRASGGLRGAVARMAEAAYAELDPYRQSIARSVLLRLAGPGDGPELVRRRVSVAELDAERDPAITEVLETLTAARLLTTGDGFVEVAHEALLREWPRLLVWLDDDAAGRKVRLHLTAAVQDWEQRGRESGDLYRGARLATALEWASEHRIELNVAEQAFLDEGRRVSDREVARQRQTNRRLRVLLAGAMVFLVLAVGTGVLAVFQGQRAEAEAARAEAEAERAGAEAARAESEAQRAGDEAARTEAQRALAEQEADRARSRELTASAISALDADPRLSKLLALEAGSIGDDPPLSLTTVLHQAFAADPVVGRYEWPDDKEVGLLWTDLDPSGQRLVASGAFYNPSNHLEVADVATGTVQWTYSDVVEGVRIGPSFFSLDGAQVMAGVYWDDPEVAPPTDELGAFIWDAETGELVRRIDLGRCGGMVTAISTERSLVRTPTAPGSEGDGCDFGFDPGPAVQVLDLQSGETTMLAEEAGLGWGATMSRDGNFAAFDAFEGDRSRSRVVDLRNGETVWEHDPGENVAIQVEVYARRLNADGSLLLYGSGPILVYDLSSGDSEPIAELGRTIGNSFFAEFDEFSQTIYATAIDRTLHRWDARDGTELSVWPTVGNGRPSIATGGETILVSDDDPAGAALLDVRPRGESGAITTCDGFGAGYVAGSSLDTAGGYAAFAESCGADDANGVTHVIDLGTGTLVQSIPGFGGGQTVSLSPDGARIVIQGGQLPIAGPLVIRDALTGAVEVELQGLCSWDVNQAGPRGEDRGCQPYPESPFGFIVNHVDWSPDGTMIAGTDRFDALMAVWDARDGSLLYTASPDEDFAYDVLFTPDSKGLLISYDHAVRRISTDTWTVAREVPLADDLQGADRPGLIGLSSDGTTVIMVGGMFGFGGGAIHWLDAETFQVTRSVNDAFEGAPKSAALSPDGSLLATGTSDGQLRLWSTGDGSLLQEIEMGQIQVQGVAFVDDSHLAVAPETGDLLIFATEPDELLTVVRASLTRSFTDRECTTYDIEPCPSLDDLKGP